MKKVFWLCSIFLFAGALTLNAQEAVGIFDGSADIGETGIEGFAAFDSGSNLYQVDASGSGIDDFSDSFFYVYKELSGNFSIEGLPFLLGGGRAGIMIRQNLEAGSPFAAYVRDGSENIFPLFRTLPNEATSDDGEITPDLLLDGSMKLERIGNTIHFYTLNLDAEWELQQTEIIQLNDPVFVGLAATAGNNDLESFDYEFVEIEEYPFAVTRELGNENPAPGSQVTVTLTAASSEIANATVSETAPAGAVISDIAANAGVIVPTIDGTLQWSLPEFSGEATLTYTVDLPNKPVLVWNGTFTDGESNIAQSGLRGGYIGGDLYAAESLELQSRGTLSVHPIIPRFIEAEWGTLTGEERPFALHLNPLSESGILLHAADGSSSSILDSILEYTLDVQETGTYYLFVQARREDSQSDSFFFGFDEIDALPENAFPIAGGKNLNRRWLQNFDPTLNFWDLTGEIRPIELTAGEHKLYISPRETNACIDWFVITSDPDMDIANYVPGERFFTAARSLPSTGTELPDSVSVAVNLGVVQGSNIDMRVEERFPEGWTVSDLSAGEGTAELVDGTIVWTVPSANADTQLTYTTEPPEGAEIGIFDGFVENTATGATQPVIGRFVVPEFIPFQTRTEPIDVSPAEITFIQAEAAHAVSGDFVVQADDEIISLLYAMPTTSGRSGGALGDQELTFELNVLEAGTYYVFANTRSESDQTDSFYIGFDTDFVDLSDSEESDPFAFAVPSRNAFARTWHRLYEDGQRFWAVIDVPRPHELTAGSHTLSWHSREPEAKVDWIAITTDPTLDLDTLLEPGQVPDTAVHDFMLY